MNTFFKNGFFVCLLINAPHFQIQANHIKAVIFDFAVGLEISNLAMAKSIGFANIGWTALSNPGYLASLQENLFKVLFTQGAQSGNILVRDPRNGKVLPLIMVSWLAGEKHSVILERSEKAIQQYTFETSNQKKLISQLMHTMFDPHVLAKNSFPSSGITKILKKIIKKQQVEMYGLSNWDAASFNILRKAEHTQEIFNKIPETHIMISGNIGKTLPYRETIEEFLSTYRLKPQECLIINAEKMVINQAHELGMHGIWIDMQNGARHKYLEKMLRKYHIL